MAVENCASGYVSIINTHTNSAENKRQLPSGTAMPEPIYVVYKDNLLYVRVWWIIMFWRLYQIINSQRNTPHQNRVTQHAKAQLTGFIGVILSDSNQDTSAITTPNKADKANIVNATRWTHTKRYFNKVLLMESEFDKEAIKKSSSSTK